MFKAIFQTGRWNIENKVLCVPQIPSQVSSSKVPTQSKCSASWEHPAKDAHPVCGTRELQYKAISQLRVKRHESDTSIMTELAPLPPSCGTLVLCILWAARNHPSCGQGMVLAVSIGPAWGSHGPSYLVSSACVTGSLLTNVSVSDSCFLRPPLLMCHTCPRTTFSSLYDHVHWFEEIREQIFEEWNQCFWF